jgi:hypothetical protein
MGQVGAGVQTLPNSVLPPGGHGAGRRSPDPGERMAKGRASQLRPLAWSAPAPGAGNIHAAAEGETAMSGAAEDGAARATPAKHEAAKTEAAKTEAAKTEAAKTEAAKSGTAEDEAAGSESATSEEDTSSEAAPEVMHVYQTELQ